MSYTKRYDNYLEFVLFLLNPIIGIAATLFRALNSKHIKTCIPLLVFCALYMGALNSTKTPTSDEILYIEQFKNVPKDGFIKTLMFHSPDRDEIKSPLYGSIVYTLYYLTFGQERLFILIITFIIYYLFLLAVYRLQKQSNAPNYIIVSGILTIVFFTQFFTLSAHLIRQMLATAVFLLCLTYKEKSFIGYVTFMICSYFIHSSMALLILISLLPGISRYYSKYLLIAIGSGVVIATSLLANIAGALLGFISIGGEMGTVVGRAVEAEGLTDDGGALSQGILLFISVPLLLISIWGILKKSIQASPVILNICLIWALIVLSLSFSPLIQYRFFYVLYFFIPIVLFLPFRKNFSLSKVYSFVVCIFVVVRFFFTYNSGSFEYAPVFNALFLPYPLLMFL